MNVSGSMNTKMLSPDHSHASRQPNHAMSAVSTTGKASTPAGGPTWNHVIAAARRRTNHLTAMASRTTGLASAMPPAPTMPYQKTKSKGVFAHFTMMKDSAMSTAPSGMMTRGAHRWSASGPSIAPTMPPAIIRSDSAPKMMVELHPSSSCMGTRNTPAAKEAPPTA